MTHFGGRRLALCLAACLALCGPMRAVNAAVARLQTQGQGPYFQVTLPWAWSALMPDAGVKPQAAQLVLDPAALGASQPTSLSPRTAAQDAGKEAGHLPRAWLLWAVLNGSRKP